jgi:hypothetical protein
VSAVLFKVFVKSAEFVQEREVEDLVGTHRDDDTIIVPQVVTKLEEGDEDWIVLEEKTLDAIVKLEMTDVRDQEPRKRARSRAPKAVDGQPNSSTARREIQFSCECRSSACSSPCATPA